ncbi:MAG: MSHA biogenesis protein MshI [Motiliproteus sp.]|jgi:MSHA biogenesis protein MshI
MREDSLISLLTKKKSGRGRVGLTLNVDGLGLAYYDERQAHPLRCQQLDQCRIDTPELLKAAVNSWGMAGCATTWVLHPKDYSLLLVEAPTVPDIEMRDALRWRIKDMVSFDITNSVIDYFPLPEDAYRGRNNMLYVAIIEPSVSENILTMMLAAGLTLEAIEIPELALLRLKALEGDTLGTAILGLQTPIGIINLVSEGHLYLTRKVDTPVALTAADVKDIEARAGNIVLDLQRSLDYFDSQIGKSPCLRLLVCPVQPGDTPLLGQLRNNLEVELVQLDLGEYFSCEPPLTPTLQMQVMLAVAAVLPENPA